MNISSVKEKLEKKKDEQKDIDFGNEVFAWIGSGASREERKNGVNNAMDYLKKSGKPDTTPITVTLQGSESEYFWKLFN